MIVTPSNLNLNPQSQYLFTDQSTSSTSFTDLATVGPAATVNIGANGMALVVITCGIYDSGGKYVGVQVSGATAILPNTDNCLRSDATSAAYYSSSFIMDSLNPGSNTFTLKYKGASGGSSFFARRITVIPL